MDPLSDVLSLLKTKSVLSARMEAFGPWALRFCSYRHIKFGGALEGSFWLWIEGSSTPVNIKNGDFYLLTDGSPYYSATDLETVPLDGNLIFERFKDPDGVVRYGRGGDKVKVCGGRFTFDHATSDILLKQLPPLIHISASSPGASSLGLIISLLSQESDAIKPGSAICTTSIANLALVLILRVYLANSPQSAGWLSAFKDQRIGDALRLMHGNLTKQWQVEDLALSVGMSRTSFSQRFKALVGFSPLDYLIRWRITVAQSELRKGEKSLSKLAGRIGYSSETAFNSAFKRITGQSPGRYRSENRPEV
jgi:AraC-like DNA-binding protein